MGVFIRNAHISCTACGYGTFSGRESSSKRRDGLIYQECRWVCPRCTRMVRLDKRTVEAPIKEEEE